MSAVPGLPRITGLPLDQLVTLGGLRFHSSWLGGTRYPAYGDSFILGSTDGRYGYGVPDWWIYLEDATYGRSAATYPDGRYVSGPRTAVDVTELFRELVGWKFFSPNGLNGNFRHRELPGDIDVTQDVVRTRYFTGLGPPDFGQLSNGFWTDPTIQHVLLGRLSATVMSGNRTPLWNLNDADIAASAPAIARYAAWRTLLLVIDGTGSSSSGRIANGHVDALIPALIAAGHSGVRLVVTKFSDYPEGPGYRGITGGLQIPALLLGTFDGIDAGTSDAINALNLAHETGGGGDVNESQFEGIHLAIATAKARGWATGARGIVVYTDAGSVVTFQRPYVEAGYLRMTQRDDGLGISPAPRLGGRSRSMTNPGTAPRVGTANRYL